MAGPILFADTPIRRTGWACAGQPMRRRSTAAAAAGADGELRELARGFEGAYPYLS